MIERVRALIQSQAAKDAVIATGALLIIGNTVNVFSTMQRDLTQIRATVKDQKTLDDLRKNYRPALALAGAVGLFTAYQTGKLEPVLASAAVAGLVIWAYEGAVPKMLGNGGTAGTSPGGDGTFRTISLAPAPQSAAAPFPSPQALGHSIQFLPITGASVI